MFLQFFVAVVLAINGCYGDGACEEVMVPMCRGLVGYTHTRLPNRFGHTTQVQVYRAIERYWPFMDSDCHKNFRLTVCGTFLPKCMPGSNTTELPCRETCFSAKRGCSKKLKQGGSKWPNKQLKCNRFRRKRQGSCLKPVPRRLTPRPLRYAYCERNTFRVCENLSPPIRTLPNMFLQSDERLIEIEMNQYRPLLQTQCHENLQFLLCGTFAPFCQSDQQPFVQPCRETCEAVKTACLETFRGLYGGLPWPAKLQCHRYPSGGAQSLCAAPNDAESILQN
ncbi:frizzled-6-like [Saccostrea cucullata]|uniref:frizzled-6-like n=1 Tax=Saccostrea cuccullata TaxID=36930 RepID=UPI002ED598D5